ncbi:hypothetical protein ACWDCC_01630 [Streptomyces sp. NPDC001102]
MSKDVRGQWQIIQTSGHVVDLNIGDEDANGTFDDNGGQKSAHERFSGDGMISDARATDDEFVCLISWDNGAKGRYSGRFDFQGRLTGVCHDEVHPSAVASWFARRPPSDEFGPL